MSARRTTRADPQLRVIAVILAVIAVEFAALFALTGFPAGLMAASSVAAMSAAAVWFESYK